MFLNKIFFCGEQRCGEVKFKIFVEKFFSACNEAKAYPEAKLQAAPIRVLVTPVTLQRRKRLTMCICGVNSLFRKKNCFPQTATNAVRSSVATVGSSCNGRNARPVVEPKVALG